MLAILTFLMIFTGSLNACNCGCNSCSDTIYTNLDDLYTDIQNAAVSGSDNLWELIDQAKSQDKNFPVMHQLEDGRLIVLNVTTEEMSSEQFRKEFTWLMRVMGLCENKEDVDYQDRGIYITPEWIKKKDLLPKVVDEQWCKDNCDSLTMSLQIAIGRLKSFKCIAVASMAVETLRRNCHSCCQAATWFQACLWPLAQYCVKCDLDDMGMDW